MTLLIVATLLFSVGLYGVLTRRDLVAVLAAIEVMLGSALLAVTGLALATPVADAPRIEAVAVMLVALTAAAAATGLALVVAVAQRCHTTRIDELREVKG